MATSYHGTIDEIEKEDAIRLNHLRTFTAEPELQFFYSEVEKVFKNQVNELVNKYQPMNRLKRNEILDEISEANEVLGKTDKEFAKMFKHSMKTYEEHVIRSRNNVVEYFLFPFDLPSLKL